MRIARVWRLLVAATVAVLLGVVGTTGVRAAELVRFGTPTATATYGESVLFKQPVSLGGRLERVEILIDVPGAAGPAVNEIEPPASATTEMTFDYRLAVEPGDLLPNTTLTARWRATGADGTQVVSRPVTVTYEDTRFTWRTREGEVVRVHWYEGSDDFGRRALAIGEDAVRETSKLLGVSETEPIDFFVYADRAAFYNALGPGTRENVGGQANAEIRTLFALITPGEINDSWVAVVIPHELTHLVFNTAVDNPYHFPPRWLNEGLAVYLSQGYDAGDRGTVEDAARNGSLIPLDGLSGQFPTTRERFFLAYAESVSAVDYLVRTHGRDALVGLIKSYANGLTDDEAFSAAIGSDVAAFDQAWRDELNAKDPVIYGPKPPPPGPLPPGWSSAPEGPTPGSDAVPGGSASPAAPAEPRSGGGLALWPAGVAAVVIAAVIVVGAVLARRRRPVP